MDITTKHLSDTRVQLTISLAKKELDAAEQVALAKLSKTMKLPGFRAGKIPISVVAKNADPGALNEQTLDAALNRGVAEAFLTEKIQALDRPSVDVKKFVPGTDLEFTAEVEIIPQVTLGDYKKLTSKAPKVTISAKDVTEIIERMQTGFAEKKAVDRPAKDGDETVIDFVGKRDGVAFDGGTATDYNLTLGSHQFIPGFEEAIVGHTVDETFDIDLSFPDDYHAKDLAGQDVTFTVTLKSITELDLPKVDDEFAKKAGPFTTVDELKADIKREITLQKERESHDALKDQLVNELVATSKVPVPDILVQDQMRSIEQDFERNLMYQGLNLDQYLEAQNIKDQDTWRDSEVKPSALKRVQAGLVLAELSKELKVEATADELEQHVERYKQQYANNPEALKQFQDPEVRRDIANRLLTEKTVDKLVELNS